MYPLPRLMIMLTFVLAGCSETPSLAPLSGDAVIVAFGDSLTYGTGAEGADSYPAQLQILTGRKVINAGIPGEITKAGLTRLPGVLDDNNPALLVLIHGGNDLLRRLNIAQTRSNLDKMIGLARDRGIDVVLLAVPSPGILLSPASMYGTLAEATGTPIDEDALAEILQYPANKSDAIHPNAKGYRIMAERVYALLQENGAL